MARRPLKSIFAFFIALLLPGASSAAEGKYTLDGIILKIKSIPQLNQQVKKTRKKASQAGNTPVLDLNSEGWYAGDNLLYRDGYISYQKQPPNEPTLKLSYDLKFIKEKEYFTVPDHYGNGNSGLTQQIGLDYRVIMAGVKLVF